MKNIKIATCLASIVAIYACSSGSSTSGLTGTAAVGAALPDAVVTLKDAGGNTLTVTADANGAFEFNEVGALTAPFILKAVGIVGGEEHTMFSALDEKPSPGNPGVINVTPMTHAIVTQLAPSGDPAALYSAPTTLGTVVTPAAMGAAKDRSVEAIKSVMQELGITNFDPFKDKFTANSTGRDKLFDLVKFQPSASGEIKIIDKATGVQTSVGKNDSVAAVTAKKLVFDPDLAKIDFSSIKTLVSGIKAAMTNKSSAEISGLIDDGFLHDGKNKSAFATAITSGSDTSVLIDFVIGACDKVTKICLGNATLKTTKDSLSFVEVQPMPVKQQTDGAWKLYGNQQSFKYEIVPTISVSTTSATAPTSSSGVTVKGGLSIRIEGNGDPAGSKVEIYFCEAQTSGDPLCSNSLFAELEVRSDCTFVYSLKNERCDETFQQVDNAAREASKATIESGKFRIKVVQTKGQSVSTKFIRPDFPYVSSEDVDGVVTRALKSFNFAELNTTAVSVGSKVVRFGAHLSGQSPLPDYPIRLERSSLASARADGKITVTELCGGDQQKPGCSNTVAKFKYVEQEFKDDVLPIRVALKATYP